MKVTEGQMMKTSVDHSSMVEASVEAQRASIASVIGSKNVASFCARGHVSLKHKYFYCETPKVGCSTIKLTLYRAELEDEKFDVEENRQIHIHDLSPLLSPMRVPDFALRLQGLFKFCFVRDPAERLVSAYLDKIVRRKPQKMRILRIIKRQDQPDYPLTFSDFVDLVCAQKPEELDPHWSIQYLNNRAGQIHYDMIGRFESFETDLRNVMKQILIDERFLRRARTHQTNASELASEYLVPEVRKKIEKMYRLDYEHFGY